MTGERLDDRASAPPAVETLVAALAGFWSQRRCVQLPALDRPIAAATFAPHTFLRLRSPRPWRIARLQEVQRPARAFGAAFRGAVGNARRLEYQVAIHPALRAADRLLIKSLRTLGLELARHQFELREHRLETNLVGVSGVGWKAFLDGVPVARLSFLVRLGECSLTPPTVEIVYLLERLAAVSPLASARAVAVAGTEREAWLAVQRAQADRELARYWLEVVDPVATRQRLDEADREAERCLERSLIWPAYERVLESAHLLEILRARDLESEDWEVRAERCRRRALECAQRWFDREKAGAQTNEHANGYANEYPNVYSNECPNGEIGIEGSPRPGAGGMRDG